MSSKRLDHLVLTLVVTVTLLDSTLTSLHNKFSHFHTLTADDFRVRVKRNAKGGMTGKYVTFNALGTAFQLLLKPGSPVLMDDFTLHEVHGNGSESVVRLDIENVYHGHLVGDTKSWVSAVYDSGIWTAMVAASSDNYYIEPLQNHDGSGSKMSMIVYRGKDIKHPNGTESGGGSDAEESSFCRVYQFSGENDPLQHRPDIGDHPETRGEEQRFRYTANTDSGRVFEPKPVDGVKRERGVEKEMSNRKLKRNRRNNRSRDTCDVLALADFKAYSGVGKKSVNTMAKFLIVVYTGVDTIFKSQKFGRFRGIRVKLRNMKVFSSPLTQGTAWRFLKLGREIITPEELLTSLSKIKFMRQFCLSHLTTQRNFSTILGLACRASNNKVEWNNGICASTRYMSRNVGLSTVVDNAHEQLSMEVYIGIVAHEIGHNFGASHDGRQNITCAPPSEKGGKYLMWYRRTMITSPNGRLFSPCSRELIGDVLQTRASRCLKRGYILESTQCGNAKVDVIEECDAGNQLLGDSYGCCLSDCTLAKHAVCSPVNSPCCSPNCTIAPTTQKCAEAIDERRECFQPTFCSGKSFSECPLPVLKADGSACEHGGQCQNGDCVSYCRLLGRKKDPPVILTPCNCESSTKDMCRRCCIDMNDNQECLDHGGHYHDGAPCLVGICSNAVCVDPTSAQVESKVGLDVKNNKEGLSYRGLLMIAIFVLFIVSFASVMAFFRRKFRRQLRQINVAREQGRRR